MAIEKDVGDVNRWVESYVSHLTSQTSGEFRTHTRPGAEDIASAIETAASEILTWLGGAGYSTDSSTYSSLVRDYLSYYNAIGAAYRLELMHPGLGFGNNPNSRWKEFYEILQAFRQSLMEEGLSGVDLSTPDALRASFTAERVTDKRARREDTDLVTPLFRRDMFKHPLLSETPPPDPLSTG